MQQIGKYRIIERLGRGGMAEVWLGHHPTLQRKVAIKVVHSFLREDADFERRFLQEARLVAALRHPNIVQLYDFEIDNERPYMVMEYLDGGTLHAHLRTLRQQQRLMPLEETARLFGQIASALAYAHRQGAVHRDLKPANVLLTDSGAAVVTDFGIAKLLSDHTHVSLVGSIIGTPSYMSPEQALGGAVDGRSDVYALGVMLYEMLTGRAPFSAETPAALLSQHIHATPTPPRELNANIPSSINRIVLQALAKQPEQRFADAQLMADALVTALGGGPLTISEPTLPGTDLITVVDQTLPNPATQQPVTATGSAPLTALSNLKRESQAIAMVAAVANYPLSYSLLSTLAGEPEDRVLAALDELWQAGIMVSAENDTAYHFRDEATRKQIVNGLSPARRVLLHRKSAELLAQQVSDDQSTPHKAIADHFERAGMHQLALYHLQLAGQQALSARDADAAIDSLSQAATLLEADTTLHDQRCAIYLSLTIAWRLKAGWKNSEVSSNLTLARAACQDSKDAANICLLYASDCLHSLASNNPSQALKAAQQFWQIATGNQQAIAHLLLASTLFEMGKFKPAKANFTRGITHYQLHRKSPIEALFDLNIGMLLRLGAGYVAHKMGNTAEAAEYFQQAAVYGKRSQRCQHN